MILSGKSNTSEIVIKKTNMLAIITDANRNCKIGNVKKFNDPIITRALGMLLTIGLHMNSRYTIVLADTLTKQSENSEIVFAKNTSGQWSVTDRYEVNGYRGKNNTINSIINEIARSSSKSTGNTAAVNKINTTGISAKNVSKDNKDSTVIGAEGGYAEDNKTTDDGVPGIHIRDSSPSTEDIVKNTVEAIVKIRVARLNPDFDFNYFKHNGELQNIANGTGFIINENGYVVTNAHVVKEAKIIQISVGKEEFEATLVGLDSIFDLAVLKINGGNRKFKFLEFSPISRNLELGEKVIAIGNPSGLGISVSSGIVSALNRDLEDMGIINYIQTDAAINPGNSGGPMLDRFGNVIGINTLIFSKSGENIGVGFAIPLDEHLVDVVEKLMKFGYNQNGFMGYLGTTITEDYGDYLKALNYKGKSCVLVTDVERNSPAEKGGILPMDIIVSYDGKKVEDWNTLLNFVINSTVGSNVEVVVLRNKKYLKLKVKVAERTFEDEHADVNEKIRANSLLMADMFVAQIDGNLVDRYKLYSKDRGLYVMDVKTGGWANINGIERGDIVLAFDQTQINGKNDVLNFVKTARESGQNRFMMLVKKKSTGQNTIFWLNLGLLDL